MAINFPSSLDTLTNPTSTDLMENATLALDHDQQHSNANDAIEALEAKVGANSSAVTTSHDYKLGEVTSTDKAVGKTATQTLTNKTLTTPVINAGSDATGDIYYRSAGGVFTRLAIGSNLQILQSNGTIPAWVANPSAANGSTTVAGIFEAATTAQVTAGTAVGETGANLVVTPDALAASTPVFNGSGITNIPGTKVVNVTTNVVIASSTADNTLVTQSIAGGTLGITGAIRVRLYFSALNISYSTPQSVNFRLKYGGTTLCSSSFATSATYGAATGYVGFVECYVMGSGATNTQEGNVFCMFSSSASNIGNAAGTPSGYNSTVSNATGTSAVDSTSAQTLVVTAQFSNSGVNDNLTMTHAVIEKII